MNTLNKSDIEYNTVRMMADETRDRFYNLYWTTEDSAEGGEYICSVYGYANALRVTTGIGEKQAQYTVTPTPPY